MSTEPVEVDSDLVARVREFTEDVPGYVDAALRRQLQDRAFASLLDDLEAESGPVPEDIALEAERFWHSS